jgi:hypothetical protein
MRRVDDYYNFYSAEGLVLLSEKAHILSLGENSEWREREREKRKR